MKRESSAATAKAEFFTLPPLPFEQKALAPIISARTVKFHYTKHHKGYVDKLNTLLAENGMQPGPLVELIRQTHGDPDQAEIFNNAAQVWNHNFYWQCLKPSGRTADGNPSGELARMIDEAFGGIDALRAELVKTAVAQFGSGWAWLVRDDDRLKVTKTGDAEVPFANGGGTPLLTIDMWEHAYYLDYQNRREDHVIAVVDELLNWKFASENLARLDGLGTTWPEREET